MQFNKTKSLVVFLGKKTKGYFSQQSAYNGFLSLYSMPKFTYITQAINFAKYTAQNYPTEKMTKDILEQPDRLDINDVIDFVYVQSKGATVNAEAVSILYKKFFKEVDLVEPEELANAIELFSDQANEDTEKFWQFVEAKAIEYISQRSMSTETLSRLIQSFGAKSRGSEFFWEVVSTNVQKTLRKRFNSELIAAVFANFKQSERSKYPDLWKLLHRVSADNVADFTVMNLIDTAKGLDMQNATDSPLSDIIVDLVERNNQSCSIEEFFEFVQIYGERGAGSIKFWRGSLRSFRPVPSKKKLQKLDLTVKRRKQ